MSSWFHTSQFDADIEKATSEKNTTELWDIILTICDKIKVPGSSKDGLRAIVKRLGHNDPHVSLQALTLLNACIVNCGKPFLLEVASREFETEYKKLLSKHSPIIASKFRLMLKKWAENEFKDDPQLDLIPSLYKKLKSEGHDFTEETTPPVAQNQDPNVSSQKEEEDIAKAILLSLQENKSSPKTQSASLYPSMSLSSSTIVSSLTEPRKVRALYDFEAVEDNELTFVAGEIIHVTDDSDQNWWKGTGKRGDGLFPSNFVTADLSVEPESIRNDLTNKNPNQFNEEQKEERNEVQLDIDEEKIDRLFHLLSEANPEDPSQDTEEMLVLENQVNQMGPLIDAELERVDRKHAQLTQLSSELVDAINLYHTLMRESDRPMVNMPFMGYGPHPNMYGMYQPMPNMFLSQSGPISSGNFPSLPGMMMPQQTMNMPGMSMQQFPVMQMPNNQQQQQPQSQPPLQGIVPPHLQNGHMSLPNNPIPTPQQQTQNNPPQIIHNPQQPPTSVPINHTSHSGNIVQPPLQNQPQIFNPPTDFQQHPINQINMVGPMPNMPPQQRTNLPNQIPMQMPQIHPSHQAQLQQSHLMQQIGASQIQLPPHSTNMHYGSIQTILPTSDSNTNIPIYQQQR